VSATSDPILSTAPQQIRPSTPREWLDALSTGTCDPDTFSSAMTDYFQLAPDGSWEVVALLDQYHRLGKIESALFQHLKSRFQNVGLGTDMNGAWRVRPSLAQDKAAAAAAVPEAASLSAVDIPKPNSEQRHPKPSSEQRHPCTGDLLRGRYRLGGILERDGVGTVYEATDLDRLDLSEASRKTAIKVLHKTVSGRPDSYNEWRRQFQYLQSLSHPSILRVHEFDRDGDTVFFSMELLSGQPLSAVLSNRDHLALERAHAAAIIRQVGDAILHAHCHGVVHGDIRPPNIFVTDEGEIRVSGFGASPAVASDRRASDPESDQQLSVARSAYASYQVLAGGRPEVGDDVYGIACLACVLLSGYHPFNNRSAAEARALHLKPRRPPGLTHHQWNALRSGLSVERERRPSDIAKWLQQVLHHQRVEQLPNLPVLLTSAPSRRRLSAIHAMILVIAVGAVMGVWAQLHFESVAGVVATLDSEARRLATAAGSLVQQMSGAVRRFAAVEGAKSAAGRSAVALPSPPLEPAANAAASPVSPPRPASLDSVSPSQAREPAAIAPRLPANNSPSRIELAFETTEVPNNTPTALVSVRRTGNLLRDATFIWWTETGTAKAGADFEPVAPRMETLRAGKDRLNLPIPIVSDSTRRQTKNFFVVIDQPGPHVSLGSRTVTKVSILPPD
jgi:serine/threonine protein kinase